MKRKESYLLRLLLEDEINGFEYGDYLLADPKNNKEAEFFKVNNLSNEPNTEDEEDLRDHLEDWIADEIFSPRLVTILKKIAPLKSKFPEILDPRRSKKYKGGNLYRVTTLPYQELKKLNWTVGKGLTAGMYSLTSEYNWKPRSNRGVTSFSYKKSAVVRLMYDMMEDEETGVGGSEIIDTLEELDTNEFKVYVMLVLDSNGQEENLLMNPDYMHVIYPDFNEGEIFYLYKKELPVKIVIEDIPLSDIEELLNTYGFRIRK